MNAFHFHADCSYASLGGSKHIYLGASEYLPSLWITQLQIEQAYGTVHEHSLCSHPLALAGEAESLLLCLCVVLLCIAPLPRAGV